MRRAASLALLLVSCLPFGASAQELQPGLYWPLPRGLNILSVVNSYNWGDVAFDPSLPVTAANATINSTMAAYTRTFSLAGRSTNVGFQVPLVKGHIEGLVNGAPASADRFGLGDPRMQLSVNLYGAPTMTPREFVTYRLHTIVGAGVTVTPPLGQYFNDKFVNLGSNRWSVKPELGASHAFGHWVVEMMAGVWLFTDNTDYAGGTRTQDPIGSWQAHLTYVFNRRIWLAADANYYTGGRTTVNGNRNLDLQKNSRIGSTFSWALNQHHALRTSFSRGAVTNIGADFNSIAVSYSYLWYQ